MQCCFSWEWLLYHCCTSPAGLRKLQGIVQRHKCTPVHKNRTSWITYQLIMRAYKLSVTSQILASTTWALQDGILAPNDRLCSENGWLDCQHSCYFVNLLSSALNRSRHFACTVTTFGPWMSHYAKNFLLVWKNISNKANQPTLCSIYCCTVSQDR